jgi:N-acetylglutamate synthase-like GNAT family acetyltransferase
MATANSPEVKIRRARSTDAPRLAVLAGELGYPTTLKELKERLARVLRAPGNMVLVAEKHGHVIGWLHLSLVHQLESPLLTEIEGLIVADGQRSGGAGAKLVKAGEAWARKHKCTEMLVRSNVVRERAHAFYVRQGYEHYKTSKVFRKPL